MYDTETRTRFIELRAQGWSIKRIASRLKVAARTLVDWNRQERENIRTLRALELEALQEKILATREHELKCLKGSLDAIEEQLAIRSHQYTSLESLYRMAALVRAEIRKVCQTPDFSDPAFTDEPQSACKRQGHESIQQLDCRRRREKSTPNEPDSVVADANASVTDNSSRPITSNPTSEAGSSGSTSEPVQPQNVVQTIDEPSVR